MGTLATVFSCIILFFILATTVISIALTTNWIQYERDAILKSNGTSSGFTQEEYLKFHYYQYFHSRNGLLAMDIALAFLIFFTFIAFCIKSFSTKGWTLGISGTFTIILILRAILAIIVLADPFHYESDIITNPLSVDSKNEKRFNMYWRMQIAAVIIISSLGFFLIPLMCCSFWPEHIHHHHEEHEEHEEHEHHEHHEHSMCEKISHNFSDQEVGDECNRCLAILFLVIIGSIVVLSYGFTGEFVEESRNAYISDDKLFLYQDKYKMLTSRCTNPGDDLCTYEDALYYWFPIYFYTRNALLSFDIAIVLQNFLAIIYLMFLKEWWGPIGTYILILFLAFAILGRFVSAVVMLLDPLELFVVKMNKFICDKIYAGSSITLFEKSWKEHFAMEHAALWILTFFFILSAIFIYLAALTSKKPQPPEDNKITEKVNTQQVEMTELNKQNENIN